MDVDVEGAVLCSGYLISKHISRGRCSLGGDLHSTGVWAGLGMETGAETRSRGGWRHTVTTCHGRRDKILFQR